MKLLDTNLLIYAGHPEYAYLQELVSDPANSVSAISVLESLGYHKLSPADKSFLNSIFSIVKIYELTMPIVYQAINLRQQQKMSLGDALIAATALEYKLPVYTRNDRDFAHIAGLTVVNPFA